MKSAIRSSWAGSWCSVVLCSPINAVADLLADEKRRIRGLPIERQPRWPAPFFWSPVLFDFLTPVQYCTTPPQLGQHTRKVLDDVLGLSTGAIDELSKQGVPG